MADSVPVQSTTAMPVGGAPTAPEVGSGNVAIFAAMLAGLTHADSGMKVPLSTIGETVCGASQRLPDAAANPPAEIQSGVDTGNVETSTEMTPVSTLPAGPDVAPPPRRAHRDGSREKPALATRSKSDSEQAGIVSPTPDFVSQQSPADGNPQRNVLLPPNGSDASAGLNRLLTGGEKPAALAARVSDARLSRQEHPTLPGQPDRTRSGGMESEPNGKPETLPANAILATGATPVLSQPDIVPVLAGGANLAPRPEVDRSTSVQTTTAPTEQIAPAMVAMLRNTDGTQSVVIHMRPAELGQVLIRIDRSSEGVAHVGITADRPETLQMLQRDAPRLQQVLDQAGVLTGGRGVSFGGSAPDQVGAGASRPDSMAAGFGHFGSGQNGGSWRENGDTSGGSANEPGSDHSRNRSRWFRVGLDIIA